jgi:hypothetical protein
MGRPLPRDFGRGADVPGSREGIHKRGNVIPVKRHSQAEIIALSNIHYLKGEVTKIHD